MNNTSIEFLRRLTDCLLVTSPLAGEELRARLPEFEIAVRLNTEGMHSSQVIRALFLAMSEMRPQLQGVRDADFEEAWRSAEDVLVALGGIPQIPQGLMVAPELRKDEIRQIVDRLIKLKIQADDLDPAQWAKIGVLVGVKEIRAVVVKGINEGKDLES